MSALSNRRDTADPAQSNGTDAVTPVDHPLPPLTGPYAARRLGTLAPSCPVVFIDEAVIDEILEFSDSQEIGEVGGFLLGGFYRDELAGNRWDHVMINEFLPATGVSNSYRSLTFTHQTWSNLHKQIGQQFPHLKIVGWQHTHPGFGVFLSRHDLFIHRNFFNQPWQVAMVVDPRNSELGLFQWQGDKIVNSGFLCVPRKTDRRARTRT